MSATPRSRADVVNLVALSAGLAGLAVLSWVWLVTAPMPMPEAAGGTRDARYLLLSALMWIVMMVGMMTPSVTPTVLLFDRVFARGAARERGLTASFAAGYFTAWTVFSLAATALQVLLIEGGIVDTMGASTRPWLAVGLLSAAAAYQLAPLKRACLDQCRSPVDFLVQHRRRGRFGAWTMGLRHGIHCLGCCWALMLLLFVGGVMNLLWVAGLSAIVLVEKLLPFGHATRVMVAAALLGAALYISFTAG